jgi:hypothetical protein
MQISQLHWTAARGWSAPTAPADLVLAFGPSDARAAVAADALAAAYPDACRVYCSGAGAIAGPMLVDDDVVVTAVRFAGTRVTAVALDHAAGECSASVGRELGRLLPAEGLRHALVISDGLRVNGSALVRGLEEVLPAGVAITGGLAADDDRFARTVVGLDGPPTPGCVALVGLYGDRLHVGTGSLGGWEAFGPDRVVTRAAGNVLHELDAQPALALYRRYLGPFAAELPASALRFPLAVGADGDARVVRTVLGVDDATATMTFAGDVPEGASVRLMRAAPEALVAGAQDAAGAALAALDAGALPGDAPVLALLVSCVGRRLVLGQRTEEELDAVQDALAAAGRPATLAGFYSYGEIAPTERGERGALHNQTMTVTLLAER